MSSKREQAQEAERSGDDGSPGSADIVASGRPKGRGGPDEAVVVEAGEGTLRGVQEAAGADGLRVQVWETVLLRASLRGGS